MAIKIHTVDFFVDKHTWLPEPTEKELSAYLNRLQVANLKETLMHCTNLNGDRMNMEKYLNSIELGTFLVRTESGGTNTATRVTIIRAYNEE